MESYLTKDELDRMCFKKIGEDVKISRRAVFYGIENIEIGNHVRIDDFCFLSGGCGIRIGDYVNISSRVSIYSTSDDYSGEFMAGPLVEQQYIHDIGEKVIIENHAIIGTNSVLLPGTIVRQGVAVGAMSFVKQELQPFKVYAGISVGYIKERSRNLLKKEVEWIARRGVTLFSNCDNRLLNYINIVKRTMKNMNFSERNIRHDSYYCGDFGGMSNA